MINPPSYDELTAIIEKLRLKPLELVRKKKIWIENYKNEVLSDQQIIQIMISNPILIERPIVINGNSAVVGRDLEKVASFIL